MAVVDCFVIDGCSLGDYSAIVEIALEVVAVESFSCLVVSDRLADRSMNSLNFYEISHETLGEIIC